MITPCEYLAIMTRLDKLERKVDILMKENEALMVGINEEVDYLSEFGIGCLEVEW